MTATAIASDDGDRELAALRAEVAALREEVAMQRVIRLGSDAPWQQMIYPMMAGPGFVGAAAAVPFIDTHVMNATCAGPAMVPYRAQGLAGAAAGGYGGQVYTVVAP